MIDIPLQDGAVVASLVEPNRWRFTTIWAPRAYGHPVTGHREFGYSQREDGSFEIFTRGADRSSGVGETLGELITWWGAGATWRSMQERLVTFVNKNQGSATKGEVFSHQIGWEFAVDSLRRRIASSGTISL
jgi:hypothetical protein